MGEAVSVPEGASGDANEGVLLSQLIQLLSQRPRHQMLIADLSALLSASLRQRAKEQGGMRSWLERYGSLFVISGAAGKEAVTLILGGNTAQQSVQPVTQALSTTEAAPVCADASAGMPITIDQPHSLPDECHVPGDNEQDAWDYAAAYRAAVQDVVFNEAAHHDMVEAYEDQMMHHGTMPGGAFFDEEQEGQNALQLRGLPYKATAEDIRDFLGPHVANLTAGENSIYMVLNRDGRPSGFARVLFVSPDAAKKCRDDLHLRSMDDRYVEVFLYSERPSRGRQRRGGPDEGVTPGALEGSAQAIAAMAAGVTKEMVVAECRAQMADPRRRRLLLSMLGVALSNGSRAYLKQMDQGLKLFLAQYPVEFSVEGSKGSEYVTYVPMNEAIAVGGSTPPVGTHRERAVSSSADPWKNEDEIIHASPKPRASPKTLADAINPTPGLLTPSDWGTPLIKGPASAYLSHSAAPWLSNWPGAGAAEGGSEPTSTDWAPPPAWPLPPANFWPGVAGAQGWPGALGPWSGMPGAPNSAPTVDEGAARIAAAAAAAAAVAMQTQPGGMAPSTAAIANNSTHSTGYAHAVRLRGLPFSASEQDVLAFFAQHDIVDRITDGPNAVNLLMRSNGRPSGQAVVQMRGRGDAELAQRVLGGQWMGSRYIEVFLYSEDGSPDGTNALGVTGLVKSNPEPTYPVAAPYQFCPGQGGAPGKGSHHGAHAGHGTSALPGVSPQYPSVPDLAASMAQAAAAFAAAGQLAQCQQQWPNPAAWGNGYDPSQLNSFPGMPPQSGAQPGCGMEANGWEALFQFLRPEDNLAALAHGGAMPPFPPPPFPLVGAGHTAPSPAAAAAAV